jgi:multiple sugar transport system permease protein
MSVTAESAPAVVIAEAPPAPRHRRFRWKWSHFFAYVILVPGAILFAAPLVWLISGSFQPVGDLFSYPPHWIPQETTLEGYKAFFGHGSTASSRANAPDGVGRWFINSAFVTRYDVVIREHEAVLVPDHACSNAASPDAHLRDALVGAPDDLRERRGGPDRSRSHPDPP